MNSIRVAGYLIFAAVAVALLLSCSPTPREAQALDDLGNAGVLINYTLVDRCGSLSLQNGPGTTVGGPDHIFLVYSIDSIQNEGSRAENFTFSAEPLFVPTDLTNRVFSEGSKLPHSTLTVPAHSTLTDPGWIVMRYNTSDPGTAINTAPGTTVSLRYEQRRGEQPVLIFPSARRRPVQNLQVCNPSTLPAGTRFQ
jgi:hypothetical protein